MIRAEADEYERHLHEGRLILTVHLDPGDARVPDVERILRSTGAQRIGIGE